jgi:proton-translocating NADH-quinone oxidoreductase chain N
MVDPILLILIPLFTAFLINLVNIKWSGLASSLAFLALLADTAIAVVLLPDVLQAPVEVLIAGIRAPLGINLVVSPLALMMSLIILGTSLLVSVYSFSYIRDDRKGMYAGLFLLLVTGSLGMVLTGDIFNLFVFFEILCISSYILVAYQRDSHALEAAIKYLVLGSTGSIFLLVSIALIYGGLGTLNLADIAGRIGELAPGTRIAAVVFFTVGIGVEAAVFPLNAWLPDAHSSAPAPISAVLSGFVIEIALIIMVKLIYSVFAVPALLGLLAVLGVATLLIGEFAAYRQENIKRMLAFSSVGQIGLILFALSLGTEAASRGALLQVLNHAAAKSVLFLISGYFILRTGSYSISDYRGIARRMPVSTFLFFFGVLSLVGVPPFFGFFSKFTIVMAAVGSGSLLSAILTGFVLLGTVIEAVYFVRVLQVFYDRGGEGVAVSAARMEAPAAALLPILLFALFLAAGALLLGDITEVANAAAQDLVLRLTSLSA